MKMEEKFFVSVIVTNYNGKKYLKNCFDSLLEQTHKNMEIIMADDGSNDDSVSFVRENYPQVILSVNEKNSGLSVTSNNGAKYAKGNYLLFYNNDTISFPNFIKEMVKVANFDQKIGVVCPIQLPYNSEDDAKMNDAQKDIGVGSDIYGYICLAKDAGHIFYPDAAIFIRKDLFEKIGGFDPDFFLYGEDMDICWRVHLLGYKIAVAHNARFRHDSFCAKTQDGKFQTTLKRRYLVERQVINKMFKYYKFGTLVWLFPKFMIYYAAESLYFLIVKLNPKMFYEVYLRAIFWNLSKISTISKNRKHIQSTRKVNDKYILNLMYPKYRKLEVARKLGCPVVK
jgi:GT2 family glycosyltransferase